MGNAWEYQEDWLALGHPLGDGHQWNQVPLAFALRIHCLCQKSDKKYKGGCGKGWWWWWQPRGAQGEDETEIHTASQDIRPVSPWHVCLLFLCVWCCAGDVKQPLKQKGNIAHCCKRNCCKVNILSSWNHLTDASQRTTCFLMRKAWLMQSIWRQAKLQPILSTVCMLCRLAHTYKNSDITLPLPFSWGGMYLRHNWYNPVHDFQ